MIRSSFLLTLVCSTCFAFTLVREDLARFELSTVPLYVSSDGCKNLKLGSFDIHELVYQSAQRFWNEVRGTRLKFVRGGIVDISSEGSLKEVLKRAPKRGIFVGCNSLAKELMGEIGSIAGTTQFKNAPHFNASYILINDTTQSDFKNLNWDNRKAYLAKLIGNAFGLSSSSSSDSIMYPGSSYLSRHKLGLDDENALRFLYPKRFY